LLNDRIQLFERKGGEWLSAARLINGLSSAELDEAIGTDADLLREEVELVRGASHAFDAEPYLRGLLTPVFFGSALNGEGTRELMDAFVTHAPSPVPRHTDARVVDSEEQKFTGFVFKIQANMDPAHHDRIAFLRITSGRFSRGMRVYHVRSGRNIQLNNAVTFMASRREAVGDAVAGDIIGLHNHGTIQIGDTFSEGETLRFTGIPNFAPELFRRVRLADPLRSKALHKGLDQLSEEGATQVFRPLEGNDVVLGAVGVLQFDVAVHRLRHEYGVDCTFEAVAVATARWVICDDPVVLREFTRRASAHLALDGGGALTYIAPNQANLRLVAERWPRIKFSDTKEI